MSDAPATAATTAAPPAPSAPAAFAVTWDYRCPFARNAHDHLVTALRAGAPWDVTFLPFCLGQAHVEEGGTPIWETPERDSGLLALQVAVTVRDHQPERFLDLHHRLFTLRHVEGRHLANRDLLTETLDAVGADAASVWDEVASGRPLATVADEHERFVASHHVWGVPTFISGPHAVFIRFMHRAEGDVAVARRTIDRVVDLLTWPELNEYKHTTVPA